MSILVHYIAYPFKRREFLNYAKSGDLEPIDAKAVAQMFQKFRKEIHVRVELIGHHQFVEGRSISLVVGTVESEPAAPKRLIKETSVVTVVGGTFKRGRGIVRTIRDEKALRTTGTMCCKIPFLLRKSQIMMQDVMRHYIILYRCTCTPYYSVTLILSIHGYEVLPC